MSQATEAFEDWIRGNFVAMNTALEALYFAQDDRAAVDGVGDAIKAEIRDEGHAHVVALWREGNTGAGFESAFEVLGNVGLYMGALRRHELTNPAREERSPFREASSLALLAGASIGMAPRFATAHLATHNRAVAGVRKSFTTLPDEFLFIDENARAILCVQRAADALHRILALGITSPVADVQLEAAAAALAGMRTINARLFGGLDTDRFFYSVRPYYKPYRVGRHEFRGANAGDFSGINEVDLLLGLCSATDPNYAQLLVDKMPFMRPEDQARLRDCIPQPSLLDGLLASAANGGPAWRRNAMLFLDVVAIYRETAIQHHDQLVTKFIVGPSGELRPDQRTQITASGPALEVLMAALALLRDQRAAAPVEGIGSRHDDLARLHRLATAADPDSAPRP